MRAVLRVACLISVMCSSPAAAEPNKIVNWLMGRPLTLWDSGMIAMEFEAERAAASLKEVTESALPLVDYNWDDNEITVTFFTFGFREELSHENCNKWRRHLIDEMFQTKLGTAPDTMRQAAMILRINKWFSHKGFQSKERDEDLAIKLSRIIFIEVLLGDNGESVLCRERATVFDAPSKTSS